MKNLNTIKRALFLYPLLALSSMKAQVPDDWTVNPSNYEHFMTFTAVLKVNIVEVQNTSNVIAAFHNGEVRGISNTQSINDRTYHFLQVYGNNGDGDITFKVYEAINDTILDINQTIFFVPSLSFGNPQDPFVFSAENLNMPPVAIAGDDQVIREEKSGILDGSLSWSSSGDSLTLEWISDPLIAIESAMEPRTVFVAPKIARDTTLAVILKATAPSMKFAYDTLLITVQNNLAPIAIARADLSRSTQGVTSFGFSDSKIKYIFPNSTIILDGSDSYDPENDSLSFKWSAPQEITLSSEVDKTPTFTAPMNSKDEVLKIYLHVSDYELPSNSDSVLVMVSDNTAPRINMAYVNEVIEGDTVYLDGSKTVDKEGDALEYAWKYPDFLSLDDTTNNVASFVVPELEEDVDFQILFGAWDGKLGNIDTIKIFAKNNAPPIANAGYGFTSREGKRAELDGYYSLDPDGRELKYLWESSDGYLPTLNGVKPYFELPIINSPKEDYVYNLVVSDGVETDRDSLTITVLKNIAPIAHAGTDLYIKKNTETYLHGEKSFDLEKDSLRYIWHTSPEIVLDDSTAINPKFISPNIPYDSTYIAILQVKDYIYESNLDTVQIFVLADLPPIAKAGPDQFVKPGDSVLLDGSASYDPDNSASFLAYEWKTNTAISLGSLYDDTLEFVAPDYGQDSTLSFSLTAFGINKRSVEDHVNVSIVDNYPPNALAGNDTVAVEGSIISLDASQSFDLDNASLSYEWRVLSGTLDRLSKNKKTDNTFEIISNASLSKIDIQTPYVVGKGEVFIVELTVSDGIKISKDTINVSVVNNQVPIANAGKDQFVKEGQKVYLSGNKSIDPDGTLLSFVWEFPSEVEPNSNTSPTPYFIAPQIESDSSMKVYLSVNDGTFQSKKDTIEIFISNNSSPNVNAGRDQVAISGSIVQLDGSKSFDIDGDSLSFRWVSPKSINLINPFSSRPSFVAPVVLDSTEFIFSLHVSDGGFEVSPDYVVVSIQPISNHVRMMLSDSTSIKENQQISINLVTSPYVSAKKVEIHYALGGDDSTKVKLMTQKSNLRDFSFIFPSNEVTNKGISYQIFITDQMNTLHPLGEKQFSVNFENKSLTSNDIFTGYPNGIKEDSWRMISLPGNLRVNSIDSVFFLSDFNLDNYDNLWKLFTWNGIEWIDVVEIKPGAGYWFNHRKKLPTSLDLSSGKTVDLQEFEFLLRPGWNMIGSPYNFPLKIVFDQDSLIGPYEFLNEERGWASDFPIRLAPFKSYAVYNTTEEVIQYKIKNYNRDIKTLNLSKRNVFLPENIGSIDLQIVSDKTIEENNIFGIIESPSSTKGVLQPEPPNIIPRTQLSFLDKEQNFSSRSYKVSGEGQEWPAKLFINDKSKKITIRPKVIKPFPRGWKAIIVNQNENKVYSLEKSFEINVVEGQDISMVVIAGTNEFISKKIKSYKLNIPTEFSLNQNYPNPFNPLTTIRYDIPIQGVAKIHIYDVLGRSIKTLKNEFHIPGAYSVNWNGKDDRGQKVSAGVYFYRLSTDGFTKTNKMILLK